MIQILGRQGVTFVIFLLCARLLSPHDFGIYNYIFSIIFMFALFSDFGLSVTVSRYTAELDATDNSEQGILIFNATLLMVTISSLACLLVFIFHNQIKYIEYVYCCLPMLLFMPLTALYDGIYRGVRRFRELSIMNFTIGLLFLPCIYYFVTTWGMVGAIVAHNIFYFTLFSAFALWGYIQGLRPRFSLSSALIRKVVNYSLLVGLSNVGLFLYTRADIFVLVKFNLIEEVGYYEVVNRFFMIIIFPAQILATVVAPKVSGIFARKETAMIKRNYRRDSMLLFGLGCAAALFFYLIMKPLFQVLFVNYDIESLLLYMALLLVLIPFRYFSTYMSIGYITPSGNVAISTVCILLFGCLNVILDVLLAPHYGLLGVIVATLLAQFLYMGVKDFAFYRLVVQRT